MLRGPTLRPAAPCDDSLPNVDGTLMLLPTSSHVGWLKKLLTTALTRNLTDSRKIGKYLYTEPLKSQEPGLRNAERLAFPKVPFLVPLH